MASKPVLYGFDGSTYVRSVRMLFAEKGAEYDQVPVNVLEGEPRQPEHLERHPFGKVPVLEHDGVRVIETDAILRYLDEVLPGPSFTPPTPFGRARMNMVTNIVDSYGYDGLIGVAGYHLFPDILGGKNDEAKAKAMDAARLVLTEIMKIKGDSPYLAGEDATLADFYLAPILFYVALTPDKDATFEGHPGFDDWWQRIQSRDSYQATEPDLG